MKLPQSALGLSFPFRVFILLFAALVVGSAAPAATVPLSTALDGAGLVWTTGGTDLTPDGTPLLPVWSGQTTLSQDGADAARSPSLISPEAESWIETTVTGPGTLSWQWRLDLGVDAASFLEFKIGEESAARQLLFEQTPWSAASEPIPDVGPVVVRWRFIRASASETAVSDVAFVDSVAFTAFGPPVLQAATALNARGFTARWAALPTATEYVLEIATSADFSNASATAPIAAPATSFVVTGLEPLATYHYRLIARNADLLEATSATLSVALPAVQRPGNDAFGSAAVLSGPAGTVNATTLDATVQTDEPSLHQASVWFTWTSPGAGRWRFLATPSSEEAFAPALHLYTGSTLATLAEVAMDPGAGLLEFDTLAGVTYRLAIDGGETPFTLAWQRLALHTPPENDDFASRILLSSASGVVSGTNAFATTQAGEPASLGGGRTVWWRWTATTTGLATFNATASPGSAIVPTLAAHTGSSLTSLSLVAEAQSTLSFPVVSGTTYHLVLDGAGDTQGALALQWSVAQASTPQIITFGDLPDVGRNTAPFYVSVTSNSGLPVTVTLVSGPASLENNLLTLTGSTGPVTLRAHQPGDGVYLPATLEKTFVVRTPPGNDAFANATLLTGTNLPSVTGSNLYASAEDLDPFPASHSVWWRWTATSVGVLTLNTAGSAIPTTLTVLTGPADNLNTIIGDTRSEVRAGVEFPVVAGVTYHIVVDAHDDRQGAIGLALSFAPPSLPQTITFAPLPDVGLDAPSFSLVASASSDLPVVFSLAQATPAATLDDGFLTLTGKPGTVEIVATQSGDAYYTAAPSITRSFTVRPPPGNDAFANAFPLTGTAVAGSNIDASSESLDPFPASRSVWWRWTAPSIGVLTLDTAASAIPVALSVLAGTSAEGLETIAGDITPGTRPRLEVPVVAGTTYHIALDSLDNQQGALSLAWSFAKPSRPQTITFDSLENRVAGDPAFTVSATASSDLPVTITLVGGPATLEDGVLTLTNQPGTVQLLATQPGDAYYAPATPVPRSFTVAKAPALKITFAPSELRQTYNGTPRSVTATTDLAPRYAGLVVTYSGPGHPLSEEAPKNAGTYTVTATADDSRQSAKLVIEKAPLTVTALDARKLAGQDNPAFALSYAGFQADDDETDLAQVPKAKTTATKTSPGRSAGYPITVSGGVAANYRFAFVPGTLHVDTFSGRYEALLTSPATGLPVAKLEVAIAASGSTFTGKLTLPIETAPVSIKGSLVLDAQTNTATAFLPIATKTNLYALTLEIPLVGDFEASLTLRGAPYGSSDEGRMIFIPAAKEKLDWTGAHTALLRDPLAVVPETDPDSETAPTVLPPHPSGSGHALATIDAKGNLKLAGRLADNTPFTATLAPDITGTYRLFAQPYSKRLLSHLAGTLPLSEHPELAPRRYLSSAAQHSIYWTKAALPSTTKTPDKSYRAGFGPLALAVTLDPWLPPVAAQKATKTTPATPAITLAQRLVLATDGTGAASLAPGFGPDDLDLGQLVNPLPTRLSLSAKNTITVVAPLTTPPNASKFSLKVAPATGAFSGDFTLADRVPAPTKKDPEATKIVTRKVTFTGVLRQPPAGETTSTFGAGYFLVPAPAGSSDTSQPSGEIQLLAP